MLPLPWVRRFHHVETNERHWRHLPLPQNPLLKNQNHPSSISTTRILIRIRTYLSYLHLCHLTPCLLHHLRVALNLLAIQNKPPSSLRQLRRKMYNVTGGTSLTWVRKNESCWSRRRKSRLREKKNVR